MAPGLLTWQSSTAVGCPGKVSQGDSGGGAWLETTQDNSGGRLLLLLVLLLPVAALSGRKQGRSKGPRRLRPRRLRSRWPGSGGC